MYGGGIMTGGSFASNTPYLSSPEYTRSATPWEVKNAYGALTGTNTSYIGGPDPLGNREMLLEYSTGELRIEKIPFWKITGSYYNELYYFSGLVAFDTYAAAESMNVAFGGDGYGSTFGERLRNLPRAIINGDLPRADNVIEVGFHTGPVTWITPGANGVKLIGAYSKLAKLTKGYRGAIQAHHIVEARHLRTLGLSVKNGPAVILSRAEHKMITRQLRQLMPYGHSYTRTQMMGYYKQAYSAYPEWIEAVGKTLGF
jgi:hypothetical protein